MPPVLPATVHCAFTSSAVFDGSHLILPLHINSEDEPRLPRHSTLHACFYLPRSQAPLAYAWSDRPLGFDF